MENFLNMFVGDIMDCNRTFIVKEDIDRFRVCVRNSDDEFTCTASELRNMLDIL